MFKFKYVVAGLALSARADLADFLGTRRDMRTSRLVGLERLGSAAAVAAASLAGVVLAGLTEEETGAGGVEGAGVCVLLAMSSSSGRVDKGEETQVELGDVLPGGVTGHTFVSADDLI